MTRARRLTEQGCRICRVCEGLSLARSTYYRSLRPRSVGKDCPTRRPANRLSDDELAAIKDVLHEERFLDLPPREIVPTLADEGRYLASIRTFYRVLAGLGEARERRLQARHPKRSAPILEACGPDQVWSWDITRLAGPWRGKFYFLYVMIDIYSRYVVGWMVSERENARRAQGFIRSTAQRRLEPGHRLTIHNDRGSPMKAGGTTELIQLLGLQHSFSRPRTSDDNPYSEAQFRTLKYHHSFPAFFDSTEQATTFLSQWFRWYNYEHRHTGLNLHTPASVHHGNVEEVVQRRRKLMAEAYDRTPHRFPHGRPVVQSNPAVVGINLMYRATPVAVETEAEIDFQVAENREAIYTN